jgi:hypothetical protein
LNDENAATALKSNERQNQIITAAATASLRMVRMAPERNFLPFSVMKLLLEKL